jgi:hypothetical protein
MWEHEGYLPKRLHGRRDSRRWRWWSEEQAKAIEEWSENRYPGAALPWYNPTREQKDSAIEKMRVDTPVETAA